MKENPARYRSVAQLVEHRSPKPGVGGSSPSRSCQIGTRILTSGRLPGFSGVRLRRQSTSVKFWREDGGLPTFKGVFGMTKERYDGVIIEDEASPAEFVRQVRQESPRSPGRPGRKR